MTTYLISAAAAALFIAINTLSAFHIAGFGPFKISWAALMLPAAGAYMPLATLIWISAGIGIFKFFVGGLPLTLWIPTALATLSMSSHKHSRAAAIVINVLFPVGCMLAFMLHPVGGAAWQYSLYWLIPAFLALANYNSIVSHALQATFVAHAAGSIIWLYAGMLTPSTWLMLIPVVAYERLIAAAIIALSLTLATIAVKKVRSH